jgi:hypothetical protein
MLLVTSSQLPVAVSFLRDTLLKQDRVVNPDISAKTLNPDPRSLTPHKNLKSEIRKLKSTQKPTTDTATDNSAAGAQKSSQKPTLPDASGVWIYYDGGRDRRRSYSV